mmetsp:Transcript_25242/g.22245  ORF Transcript_25242/g.22245 Transcript_25242/m.22245 type:complete len:105 (+) Transcript_25242:657-971(+)|eukprot:CAMPEP_0114575740 /NCGR_PEP_ID=MMETSP0125-20121206/573_1 /TAXON_ID=485358 ORGANISM="Aristerostoma sp., Strain ATCC 50986" /NCGR_SAMPLE_ID=MMETSP0125 /ASSEMBLY_ACC=CAM_ASM_000245 /LENGTH=104 /DNA_ID=CAMNT_0001763699 /DNA_START=571 /DNA_END=885 /DNA_ORIENTATION=-
MTHVLEQYLKRHDMFPGREDFDMEFVGSPHSNVRTSRYRSKHESRTVNNSVLESNSPHNKSFNVPSSHHHESGNKGKKKFKKRTIAEEYPEQARALGLHNQSAI